MEKITFGKQEFHKYNREETVKKKWGNRYFGNPVDKELQDFGEEFESPNIITEKINGMDLNFIVEGALSGGGYLFSVNMLNGDHDTDDVFVSFDTQYAYPFFEAMKEVAKSEANPDKVLELAKIMAMAVPKGIKKKGLNAQDLTEIQHAKQILGQWDGEVEIVKSN